MIRWSRFQKWSIKNIPLRRFYECKQLPQTLNNKFDFFFAGSDQIWNYKLDNVRHEDCFLFFAEQKKRISVSASFGINEIPDNKKDMDIKGLSGFSKMSVREGTGAAIVKDLIDKEVPVLIDPVMMLKPEDWKKVEKKPRVDTKKPYILKYYLGENETEIDQWAKRKGFVIYDLFDKNNKKLYSSGPGEFISLIRNALLVCSDSFHCIVLSILFSRPFIVYERQGKEDYMFSRLATLLKKFGLENRWNHSLTADHYLNCDYSHINERLEAERKLFVDYIAEAVSMKPKY